MGKSKKIISDENIDENFEPGGINEGEDFSKIPDNDIENNDELFKDENSEIDKEINKEVIPELQIIKKKRTVERKFDGVIESAPEIIDGEPYAVIKTVRAINNEHICGEWYSFPENKTVRVPLQVAIILRKDKAAI